MKSSESQSRIPRNRSAETDGFYRTRADKLRSRFDVRKWAPPFRWAAYGAIAIAIFSFLLGIGIAVKYGYIARFKYDIAEVEQLEKGCAVISSEGEEIGRLFVEDRILVPLDEISHHLRDAVLATEDSRYYDHGGFDIKGMFRAAYVNLKERSIKQGASTITQQVTRHVFRLRGKNFDRKFTEIFLARRLEAGYSKDEILEIYLNRIYLGSGYYGVGAAARGYFGKKVDELTLSEAALLAGIIKSPASYSPFVSPEKAKTVRNLTLYRMETLGMISEERLREAREEPVVVQNSIDRDKRPFFAMEAIRREIEARYSKTKRLDGGEVLTTINGRMQDSAIDALREHLARIKSRYGLAEPSLEGNELDGAIVIIENSTGKILASVGGSNFKEAPFDYALAARRRPGTAFIPFTFASYFSTDKTAFMTPVLDAPKDNRTVMIGGKDGPMPEWGDGKDQYLGLIPAARALLEARSAAAVRVGHKAGLENTINLARNCGIESPIRPYPASFVGNNPVKLVELTRAYSAFASGGRPCPAPHFLESIRFDRGRVETPRRPRKSNLSMPPHAADQVREVLAARLRHPGYSSTLAQYGLEQSGLAGMSGSSQGFSDAWFVGFDSEITCGVWIGFNEAETLKLEDPGRVLAFPLWSEVFFAATDGSPDGWPLLANTVNNKGSLCIKSSCKGSLHCLEENHPLVSLNSVRSSPIDQICEPGADAPPTNPEIRPAVIVEAIPIQKNAVTPTMPVLVGDDPYALKLRN